MTLIKFSNQLPRLLDRFFDNEIFDWAYKNYSMPNTTLPSVNIKTTNDTFELAMAVPGLSKEDFKINIDDGMLSISCEKQTETKEEKDKYTRQEFSYQSFCRSFTLPNTVDQDKIEAKYENGILHIILPKKEEAKPKPVKQITIS